MMMDYRDVWQDGQLGDIIGSLPNFRFFYLAVCI